MEKETLEELTDLLSEELTEAQLNLVNRYTRAIANEIFGIEVKQ